MGNTIGLNERVPEIEWYIRTMKEVVWAIVNTLPFENILTAL